MDDGTAAGLLGLLILVLVLPLLLVMFLAERGLWRQAKEIRERTAVRDRSAGRRALLAWFALVLATFLAVWAGTGDPVLGVLGAAIGSALAGVIGPMILPKLRRE